MNRLKAPVFGLMLALVWSAMGTVPGSAGPSPPLTGASEHLRVRPVHGHRVIQHQMPLRQAIGTLQQRPSLASSAAPLGTASWTSLGPQPISGLSTYGQSAGRVTAIVAKGSTVYLGAADGGVWRTTSTEGWKPLTDSQPTLAIGALAVQWGATPDTDTVYAGSGEGNHCADCLASLGVMKSADGGKTWSAPVNLSTNPYAFEGLVIDRTNPAHLMAATTAGLYESTDSGASWTQRQAGRFDTVVQDPISSTKFWASHTTSCGSAATSGQIGAWDSGTLAWTALWNGAKPTLPAHAVRIGLDVGPNRTAYAAVAACAEGSYSSGQSEGILKSVDSGSTWSLVKAPDFFSVPTNPPEYQGWYDNVVGIDPNDPSGNTAVFGGVTMVATADGGGNFTDVALPYSNGPLHPDFHAVAFTGRNTLYVGNDGGISYTTNLGGSGTSSDWINKSAGLSITQFYQGSSLDLTRLAGGSQDNGTAGNPQGSPPAAWKSLLDGDGFWTAMPYGDNTFFGETSGLDIFQLDYAGVAQPKEVGPCSTPYTDPSCQPSERTAFNAPFVMDPIGGIASSARIYAGTYRVYRTTSGGLPAGGTTGSGAAWTPISQDLTFGPAAGGRPDDFIHTMAIGAGSTANTVLTGSWYGKVFQTNGGSTAAPSTTWNDITGNLPTWSSAADSGNAWITGIAVNPLDSTEVWVTIGATTGGRVFHTNNASGLPQPTVWTDISATLPANLEVDSITVDPIKPQNVYIGTDVGAMACATCGGAAGSIVPGWVPLGTGGLPNVRVDAITLTRNDVYLVAWTHGRGAWSLPRPYPTPGASLQPARLTFSQTMYTTSAPQTATLTSTGTGPLNVSSIAVGGNDWTMVAPPQGTPCPITPFALAPGQSCTVGVTYTPTTTNAETGTLTVTDDSADSPHTTMLDGNGTVTRFWETLGGSLSSSPAATSWGPTRVDVFARGQDLALYEKWWDGSTWHDWSKLGGSLSSDPVAVSWGPNRLDVFARGQDLALYHMWTTNGGTTWNWWEKLGGALSSNPGASTSGVNRIDLYAAGQDKALYHMWTSDGTTWNPWTKLGGSLSSDPAATSWGSGRLDVFARGQDQALYHMWSVDNGANWHWWDKLGGSLSSSPAAATWGANRLDLFALGQDKAMYHMWSTDGTTFNSWQQEGGSYSWAGNPTAASRGRGVIELFVRGNDTALWHKSVAE